LISLTATYLDGCVIGAALALGCAAIATTLGANDLVAAPVLPDGSEKIKKDYLGLVRTGGVRGANRSRGRSLQRTALHE
jgi:hypothetical protein